ncbi:MAG: RsmB/NOP family class I SAM-dependent RNA methyltransferase [bacterium]
MNPLRSERIYARQTEILISLLEQARTAVQAGQPVDSLLSRFYREHTEYGSRDRRLFSGTVFSFFRWKGWLDVITPDLKTAGVFAHLLDATELHPAMAKLAAACGIAESALSPMGSLTLAEKSQTLGPRTGHSLACSQLVPAWVIPMLSPPDQRSIEAFQNSPPTWLRVRPEDRESILTTLKELNADPMPHPLIRSAVAVARGINLRSLPRGIRDQIEVQDLSSQVTTLICAPQPGQRWWDACAGSGGKTLHLAALAGPSASILATDIRSSVLESLERRLQETGIRTVTATKWDGLNDTPPQGPFDGILLDAPCSGIGTWHRNPDARWRITEERVAELTAIQASLLSTCATRLKPGGVIIYATCTLTPMENGAVISQFLKTDPAFMLDPFINPLNATPCPGKLQIMPWDGPCNGMFIARLKKKF